MKAIIISLLITFLFLGQSVAGGQQLALSGEVMQGFHVGMGLMGSSSLTWSAEVTVKNIGQLPLRFR